MTPYLLTTSEDDDLYRSVDRVGALSDDAHDEMTPDDVPVPDDTVDPETVKALLEGQYPSFDRLRDARSRIAQERALASVRGAPHGARRARTSRRSLGLGLSAAVVALVLVARLLGGSDSTVEVTATTPAEQLPWRSYTSPAGNFRVDLPGAPQLVPIGGDDSVAVRMTLSIPGAEIAIDVDPAASGSSAVLQAAAQNWAGPKGLAVQDVAASRVPWGNAIDATLVDPSPVGLVRVTSTRTYQFTVTVRSAFVSARTASIYERIATSFRAVDPR